VGEGRVEAVFPTGSTPACGNRPCRHQRRGRNLPDPDFQTGTRHHSADGYHDPLPGGRIAQRPPCSPPSALPVRGLRDFQNTEAVDPVPLDFHEIPHIYKPEVMPIVGPIGQVAGLGRGLGRLAGAGPRTGGPMHAAIDRHGPPDGGFTREVCPILLCQEPMNPKAPRPRVLLLQIQPLFAQRQRQLVVGMGDGARPLVFEAFKPIPFTGRNNRLHM
jgi:hypothetical protein